MSVGVCKSPVCIMRLSLGSWSAVPAEKHRLLTNPCCPSGASVKCQKILSAKARRGFLNPWFDLAAIVCRGCLNPHTSKPLPLHHPSHLEWVGASWLHRNPCYVSLVCPPSADTRRVCISCLSDALLHLHAKNSIDLLIAMSYSERAPCRCSN